MNGREMLRVAIHPKPIVELRISYGNVAGDSFGEAESGKDAKRSGQSKLSILSFFRFIAKPSRGRQQSANRFRNFSV
jgi:hypothetical protein